MFSTLHRTQDGVAIALNRLVASMTFVILDGKLLSLEDIWKQVPEMHKHFLSYDKWSFITQQVGKGII